MPVAPDQRNQNKQTAQQIGEIASSGNIDALDDILAEDVIAYWPGLEPVRGREEYKETIQMFRTAFPDLTIEDQSVIAEDDTVSDSSQFGAHTTVRSWASNPPGTRSRVQQ